MNFCEFYGHGGKVYPSRLAAAYAPGAEAARPQPHRPRPELAEMVSAEADSVRL